MTLSKLHSLFKAIMKRQNDRIDPIRSTFGTLEKEEVDMDENGSMWRAASSGNVM